MRLISSSQRGFIGHKKHLGVDQIDIDFTQFGEGLIAFVGENGLGKTTTLENLQPFRQLVSVSGPLQKYCHLRDSHRDNTFEAGGVIYRSKILINAETGKQKAYLYADDEPLNNGNTDTYDAIVRERFQSPSLFFRSLFLSQKVESFQKLNTGARQKLFHELIGSDHILLYSESAKEKAKPILNEIDVKRSVLAMHQRKLEDLEETQTLLTQAQADLEKSSLDVATAKTVVETLTAAIHDLEIRQQQAQAAATHRSELQKRVVVFTQERQNLQRLIEDASNQQTAKTSEINAGIERAQKIADNKELIDLKCAELDTTRAEIEGLQEQEKAVAELRREKAEAEARVQRLESAMKQKTLRAEQLVVQIRAEAKRTEIAGQVPCNGMDLQTTCPLLKDARESQDRIKALREEEILTVILSDEIAEISTAKQAVADIEFKIIGSDFDVVKLETKRADLAKLVAGGWTQHQQDCAVASQKIEALRAQQQTLDADTRHRITELQAQVETKTAELKTVETEVDALAEQALIYLTLTAEITTKTTDKESCTANLRTLADRYDAALKQMATMEAKIEDCNASQTAAVTIETELSGLVKEAEEWLFLARACGKDGLQQLELSVAGPGVSVIANEIMRDLFDSRWQVEFETTRPLADGSGQREVFDIWVYSDGDRQELETLSGGEAVWVENALSQAIAIYNRRKTGCDLRTLFLDEKDGALDIGNAMRYLEMLESARRQAGAYQTLVITHRKEFLNLISQQIRLIPGKGIEIIT